MSGNGDADHATADKTPRPKTDRRVSRTRDRLGEAMIALMQEKTFEEITVQHVLDRAGVGRSTFYAHYSDKNDLFLSDVEDFFMFMSKLLARQSAPAERVAPVEELFGHIADVPQIYESMAASGKLSDVLVLGQGLFARSIAERLTQAGVTMEPAELACYAAGLAGSLFSLLEWWMGHGRRETAAQMEAMFHRLVWRGVGRPKRDENKGRGKRKSASGGEDALRVEE